MSTARLMRTRYPSFSGSHGDAAASLQAAQRAVRSAQGPHGESLADPYYWAGFTLSGSRP